MQKFNLDVVAQSYAEAIMEVFPINPSPGPGPVPGDIVIREIQAALNERYGTSLTIDGVYGPATKKAMLQAVQIELNNQFGAGLAVDGIWGPKTQAAMVNLKEGMRGNLVWLLQSGLYLKGYKTGIDGIFGPKTTALVKALQNDYDLAIDGIAGKNTQKVIYA
jgi:peptidoglycan hydrolase-like protein with peptidoglycan-binding domain